MKCENCSDSILSPNHITLDDELLFRKVMYFHNWKCLRTWMNTYSFPIRKESMFAIDIENIKISPMVSE